MPLSLSAHPLLVWSIRAILAIFLTVTFNPFETWQVHVYNCLDKRDKTFTEFYLVPVWPSDNPLYVYKIYGIAACSM